jgi:predicted 3-demethylubiquinone-9 3-methyltransferase (glyoxalase superfamily)
MMQKITPFLWFDTQAEDAVKFYTSVFDNSKILNVSRYDESSAIATGMKVGSAFVVSFQLEGQNFTAMNAGPHFKLNESISLFAYCESDEKIEKVYKKLCEGGKILFPLDKYDWSPRYAWVVDKFGLSWQLDVEKINSFQKILPALLFVNEKAQRVKEAAAFYGSVFPNSKIMMEYPHDKSAGMPEGTLLFAQFKISDYLFNAMSGGTIKHEFDFDEAFSFVVDCKDQEEVDYYWNKLTSDGGQESMCAWLKDKFGVSWQIVPKVLIEMLGDKNPLKAQKAMQAMLQMKKIIIKDLEKAYNN